MTSSAALRLGPSSCGSFTDNVHNKQISSSPSLVSRAARILQIFFYLYLDQLLSNIAPSLHRPIAPQDNDCKLELRCNTLAVFPLPLSTFTALQRLIFGAISRLTRARQGSPVDSCDSRAHEPRA